MKVGFTAGSFDLCHFGHVLMFEECKRQCDYLIVAVQTDPTIDRPDKNKPIQSLEERIGQVKALRAVDTIVVYDTEADLYNYLKASPPTVRFLGADWEGKPFTGHDLKIPIVFNTRSHNYSSSELRKRILDAK
jgi:glycerol-3-phosphate cytidylyltransferase